LDINKEKQIIYDTIQATYRSSHLLYDNLGIQINREKALYEYCLDYNSSPKILGITDEGTLIIGNTQKERHKYPDKLSSEEEVCALMKYALRYMKQNWGVS
jgi:hypothetical protein